MDQEKYLSERVEDQINWLDGKAGYNQTRFKRLRMVQLLCSASIPFLAAIGTRDSIGLSFEWIVGILGVIITVVEGMQALYKYQELWLQYRSTAEALKREKMLFLTSSGRYGSAANAFALFVDKVEAILASESKLWKVQMEQEAPAKPSKEAP